MDFATHILAMNQKIKLLFSEQTTTGTRESLLEVVPPSPVKGFYKKLWMEILNNTPQN